MISSATIMGAMYPAGEEVEKLGKVWDSLVNRGDPLATKREW